VGLYFPSDEHESCGLGFLADLRDSSHAVVANALCMLERLAHRGAVGRDPKTSDGAGILIQLPHAHYAREMERAGVEIPNAGDYGVAQGFLSRDPARCAQQMSVFESAVRYHNQKVIAWRDVPIDPSVLGPLATSTLPAMKQLFIARVAPQAAFERTLFMIRKRAGRLNQATEDDFYVASCSSKIVVYKSLALADKLARFYPELAEESVRSSFAMVHSRFSTNTFPTWARAHPYRRIAHNGEINTLRGNQRWMQAREPMLSSPAFAEHIDEFKPIIRPGGSDSASLDNVVDFLVCGGRPIADVMMMLVPRALSPEMSDDERAFAEYNAALVEPWDGPAAIAFTDGDVVGAMLDRNGLRPGRFAVLRSGLVMMASEAGVLDFDADDVVEKGRLEPGKMLLVDLRARRIVRDEEVRRAAIARHPYRAWIEENSIELDGAPTLHALAPERRDLLRRAFGYTREEERVVLAPMAERGEEPTGSMGNDTALAVLSDEPQLKIRYFKQQFAQVTNPPIDPIREKLVMSLASWLGGEGNLLAETPRQCRLVRLRNPMLTTGQMSRLRALPDFPVTTIATLFDADGDPAEALSEGLHRAASDAIAAVDAGASVLVLSDRDLSRERAAIPSMLACAAVHHALLRAGRRMRCGIVVESGEPRAVADIALLIGYGAGAVHPYLALEIARGISGGLASYLAAIEKGLLKIMAKMGISTLSSYHGAQIFEAVGIAQSVVDRYFPDTPSRVCGIGLDLIAREALARHERAFENRESIGGVYAWRAGGEKHGWTPEAIARLQHAVRSDSAVAYADFAAAIGDVTLRSLWDFAPKNGAISIDEVKPAAAIVRRFSTGAMSFGSLGKEAHETLAIAMNRIGGKSNSGEGGEDPSRHGGDRRSAIKQIASARFGVTASYLVSADELQIKIAQGAKPGEGGQLPGHKVDAVIARVRHATPGVTLISPPPHHDIYSIEDLAQLIFDLRAVNPRARISVKLVSEAGVGTVAAGVAKAGADAIHIAGHDGGTGASPLSSVHHAGTPWEIGLSEAQQVLALNGLRERVRLLVDGQMRTGRDVAFAALLGAEEFGFATAPLIASGCVLTRKCHLNSCPVGIATQDPDLRARFRGLPEHVVRYFFFVAEELRAIMASLGFRTLADMVGRTDCIAVRASSSENWGAIKSRTLDFSGLFHAHGARRSEPRATENPPDDLIADARISLKYGEPTSMRVAITNRDRAFGASLAGEIARRWGESGLPDATITIELTGTAGQSFGAFATSGMLLVLEGEANDYVGKGLCGGTIAIFPPRRSRFRAEENVIAGNTLLYGATRGKLFLAGRAGERFAVRNSGAHAVVEGVGDHACEYMTGGAVIVLGEIGRNFGAGMSGGAAYVLDAPYSLGEGLEIEPLDAEAEEFVRAMIEEHVLHTRSARGSEILRDFKSYARRFVCVISSELKNAMERKAARVV